jgi:hypothetical protein
METHNFQFCAARGVPDSALVGVGQVGDSACESEGGEFDAIIADVRGVGARIGERPALVDLVADGEWHCADVYGRGALRKANLPRVWGYHFEGTHAQRARSALESGGQGRRFEERSFKPRIDLSNRTVGYASKAVASPPHSKVASRLTWLLHTSIHGLRRQWWRVTRTLRRPPQFCGSR